MIFAGVCSGVLEVQYSTSPVGENAANKNQYLIIFKGLYYMSIEMYLMFPMFYV